MSQLRGQESHLEVFDLQFVDPWSVETAITTLYEGQPPGAAPTVSSDYGSQRLLVRGSEAQIAEVRGLLTKMGEVAYSQPNANGGGEIRTIPFRGDTAAAVQQIQQLWPRLRQNRIQVVIPSAPGLRIDRPQNPPPADDDGDDDSPNDSSAARRSTGVSRFVAIEAEGASTAANDAPTAQTEAAEDMPAVVIVPDQQRITIASADLEALDQMESLLRAISGADAEYNSSASDFAVFLLRNTGASEIRQLLGDLFEQVRENSGVGAGSASSLIPAFGPNFGEVAVVADDRLNALIVHGDRQERQLIQELLEVLDSEDLPNPIVVYSPELVSLRNAQANRVIGILRNVYRSQLTTGGGRRSVEIPEGVSPEVASVLQQINAAAAAPVLTLDIDRATNSIIMRAPPELRREIKSFVSELDDIAETNVQRNVRVIQLKRAKSDNIQAVLEQFILDPQRD